MRALDDQSKAATAAAVAAAAAAAAAVAQCQLDSSNCEHLLSSCKEAANACGAQGSSEQG